MKRLSPIEANTPIELSNDTFSMIFIDGDLRKVHFSGHEIIQRFYFAVRDKDWLNIPYTLNHFREKVTGQKTVYSYELEFRTDAVHFKTLITVTLDGKNLTLEAKGEALSSFLKNRIGFCVLLPISMKGLTCNVFHPDETSFMSVFPVLISHINLLKTSVLLNGPFLTDMLRYPSREIFLRWKTNAIGQMLPIRFIQLLWKIRFRLKSKKGNCSIKK